MNETKPWAILVVIICTIFTSTGSLFLKIGASSISFSTLSGIIDGWLIIVGLFLYFIGFILLTFSFRHGELSVLFPFVSLGFVWVAFLSYLVLGELITLLEMIGVGAIVIGVTIIGLSSKNGKLKLRG